ncbi:tetratricopeptide repeat protein [Burkholderia vietnamiensis]|uniref:tetratricopeptide repeat protein n=1 Tax=Burkholderia vietnamiensis TaxID=60552 RepID=UPI000B006D3A|nr:tetratricopeptide repeat protein [Burkholderia vietnamiensis]
MTGNRPRIAPPWLVLVLAGVVLLAGYAVAPHDGLRERMAAVGGPSDLSAAYLEAWLKVRPRDEALLSMLGEQYVSLGRLADAGRVVQRMDDAASPPLRQAAMKLQLAIAQQRTNEMQADDPRRSAALAALRRQISAAAALDWSDRDLEWFAQSAASAGAPALALRFYVRLAQRDTAHRDTWDGYVSRYALQIGDYKEAADSWFRRQQDATTLGARRRCFIAGIRVLQAGNLTADAIAVAQRQNDAFIDDQPTLVALLDLARAAQRPDLIERYAKALARRTGIVGIAYRGGRTRRVPAMPAVHRPGATPQAYAYLDGPVVWGRARRDGVAGQLRAGRDGHGPFIDAAQAQVAAPMQPRAHLVKVSLQRRDAKMRFVAATQVSKHAGAVQLPSPPAAEGSDIADLLYQSFLESADPVNAQKVALAQLARDPHSALWRKRLAQVAEWNGSSQLALKSWLDYARQTGDPVGWRNVRRIAPMLDDDDAYLAALLQAARATPDDLKLVDSITATYERLGRPDDAIAFLDGLPHGAEANALDERAGALAERAGHDDEALAIYRRLQRRDPHNPRYALHTANVLYRDGDYAGALDAMTSANRYARDDDVTFWRNYGELARLLQRDGAAHDAYRHLLASDAATPDDLADMSYFYDAYPIDAGRISALHYRRDHTVRALQQAVYYYTAAGATERIDALLASLTPQEREAADASPDFLGVRAEYERQAGRPLDALHDLRRAVELPGASTDLDAALLWTLVDYGTDAELRAALDRWRGKASGDAPLWGPYAAAELRLNRPVDALEYLRRQAVMKSHDPLWLLTYADAQEMAGRPDLAWSIRRKVWLQSGASGRAQARQTPEERDAPSAPPRRTTPTQAAQLMQRGTPARTSQDIETRLELRSRSVDLAAEYSNADHAVALLDELLKDGSAAADFSSERRSLLGDARGLAPLEASARGGTKSTRDLRGKDRRAYAAVAQEVAMTWALSHEANPLAKRWLALQAANLFARPASAQLTAALADGDLGTMERLLDRGVRLPAYDRIDAAEAVDRPGQAQTLAFEGLDGAPDDGEMHRRFVDTALAWPQSLDASVTTYAEHPLDYSEQTVAASRKIAGRYMIGMTATLDLQRSTDASQLVNVPSTDRSLVVHASRHTRDAAFTVSAGRREGLDAFYTIGLGAEFGRNGPLQFGIRAGRDQVADELPTLRIGGMKDNLIADGSWHVNERVTVSGSVEMDRFYSQARTYLGSGVLSTAQVSYRIRTAYPDYTIRVVGTHGDYGATGRADALISSLLPAASRSAAAGNFMPATYTQYGLFAGFGTDLRERYTHRWRPFLEVGIVHDSIQGRGATVDAGMAGSVFGGDHAALFIQHQRVSRLGTPVTVVGAQYRWFY